MLAEVSITLLSGHLSNLFRLAHLYVWRNYQYILRDSHLYVYVASRNATGTQDEYFCPIFVPDVGQIIMYFCMPIIGKILG
jgi:hypothetical protein